MDDFRTTAHAEMLASISAPPDLAPAIDDVQTADPADPVPRWALVVDGKVFTVVQQDTEPALPGYLAIPVLAGQVVSPGDAYAEGEGFTDPDEPDANPTQWLIDVGPFFDRFGAAKMAILTSASPVARALVTDCMVRRWIDLRRADLPGAIDMLIATGIPGVTTSLKASVLDTPVSAEENMALRVAFFGGVA